MKRILIIAGEASSDMHAGNLVKEITALRSDIQFFGLGGVHMEKAGVEIYHNITHLAFIGPGGLIKGYMKLRNIYRALCKKIIDNPPDCAVLIDYAEFNLRVARILKKKGVPVIYYISPQIWAWGLWRVNTIRKLVDEMIVFFKFEENLYKDHGVRVKFVGHPLAGSVKAGTPRCDFRKKIGIEDNNVKIAGILPGSRESEIKHILPIMLESAGLLSKKHGNKIQFVLPLADTIDKKTVENIISGQKLKVIIVQGETYNAINACECAMVASGTATLETALLGVPMAIIYKTNFLTYILTKNLIKLPFIGLVNIAAGKSIVPEFLQNEAMPEKIAEYLDKILKDKQATDAIKKEFISVSNALGHPGASRRAASEIIDFLNKNQAYKIKRGVTA
jgi:lipid-A-disaccharide synthase